MNEKFNTYSSLKTPVLFLIFKRIDTTKQVFEQIRKAKPPKLYIAADGPRENIEGEAEKCKAVREYVLNSIDWDCKVKTLFREKNLGCGKAVSEAITWFFEQEEKGIILEDDILPSLSFLGFCEELLEKYKNDIRIWHIGGCNFQNGIIRGDGDYYFSALNHIWGWASWADRWRHYDFELKNINDDRFIENYWKGSALRYWKKIFWKMKNKEIDTWDYQWTFTMWFNNGLAILPNVNMITNIGFSLEGTHTTTGDSKFANMKRFDLILKKHPTKIERNIDADEYTYKHHFSSPPIILRVYKKIKRIIHDL
jgi:hypothetical protein